MKINRGIIAFHVLMVIVSVAWSGTTGKISGKVSDSKTQEGIPSAAVSLVGTTLGTVTDEKGNYVILNVPPGTYSVSVSYIGYQSTRINNVGVNVDFTTTLNIQMNESAVELNEFVVEGERNPLIRQDLTNQVSAVTAEKFEELPVTSVTEVVGLQAGVVVGDNGAIHVRGGRSNELSYTLNGVSLNDPYDNFSSLGVATNALQEVSVSTGTFSAEYGNALSGVINYVTKEGGQQYSGSVRAFTGDYVSRRKELFPHIDVFDLANNTRVEATLGGPLLLDEVSFYASAVFEKGKGFLYGERIYNPSDFYVTRDQLTNQYTVYTSTDTITYIDPRYPNQQNPRPQDNWFYFNPLGKDTSDINGLPTGDRAIVPLNTSESFNIQANLTYRLTSTMKVKYEIILDKGESKSAFYNTYRFNPDGRPTNYSNGIIHVIDWTNTLDNKTFYTVKAGYNFSEGKTYAYENIRDPRYLPGFYQKSLPNISYLTGGVSLGRTTRSTETFSGKVDIVSQLFDVHEVKAGVEARKHRIEYESYSVEFYNLDDPTEVIIDFNQVYSRRLRYGTRVPSIDNGYTAYLREPLQVSAYLQDKIEISKSLILNAGVRYEMFDPNVKYNYNLSTAITNLGKTFLTDNLKAASVKHTVSPRVSIAYPITDQGVIRFSYGHFYQFGDLSRIYQNPYYRRDLGVTPVFGNGDVRPQRNVQYEIGLQQGLTPDLRLEVVGFIKDTRDYIFTQYILEGVGTVQYYLLTNLDYANSRGITISLFQRRAPGTMFSSSIDYTYAIAEGNRTEPVEEFFFNNKSGKSIETFLVPLDFDRRHTLNATLTLTDPDNFVISNIWRLKTGSPYTPSFPTDYVGEQSRFVQNDAYKSFQWSADLKIEKFISMSGVRLSLFVLVDNLFDTENEISVWSNSGKALYNANENFGNDEFEEIRRRVVTEKQPGLIPQSAIEKYYASPSNVSSPRLVRFGVSVIL